MFAEVGPGGLQPSDFELVQQMARLSVQQVNFSSLLPPPPGGSVRARARHPLSVTTCFCTERRSTPSASCMSTL